MQTYSYYIQILFSIFLLISHIVHTSRHTDLFVEVTNITKGNGIWAHFVSTGCFPTQIQLLRPTQKDDVQIETVCCICHAAGMEEGPKAILDIQCLQRGGGVALTSMIN